MAQAFQHDVIVIEFVARVILLDGELYRLEGRRLGSYRVHHVDGYEVATVRITAAGFVSSKDLGERVVRAWQEHCAKSNLGPWPTLRP